MDRRLTGAALLLGAVVGVGVLSGLNGGSATGGFPVAEQIPPPPGVGDCVTGDVEAIQDSWGATSLRDLDLPVGSCSGARDAEVVSIIDDFAAANAAAADRDGQPSVSQSCYMAALDYLEVGDGYGTEYGQWSPAVRIGAGFIGPSDRQIADGQRWAACVVYAPDPDGQPTGGLTSSVRGVLARSSPDTARFGLCLDRSMDREVSCARPHQSEVFAELVFPLPGPDPADLLRSCHDVVAARTLMPDPTAAAALTIAASIDPTGVLTFDDGTPGQFARCTVSPTDPDRSLTSTLRGLQNLPLPLN